MAEHTDRLSVDEMIAFLESCRHFDSICFICADPKRRKLYAVKDVFLLLSENAPTYPAVCIELDGAQEFSSELRECAEECETYVEGQEDWEE